jgi:PBSX family phage portal protein
MSWSLGDEYLPITSEAELWDYASIYNNGKYYEPPFRLTNFEKSLRSNTHHTSGLAVKRNVLLSTLTTSGTISRADLQRAIHDYLATGNCYFLLHKNITGKVKRVQHLPALYMRVGVKDNYYYTQGGVGVIEYPADGIIHLKQQDMRQEIYGVPEWFAAMSSVALSESAVLFRRKYYKNGAHAGFLFYLNNPKLSTEDDRAIEKTLNSLKDTGAFKNMYVNARGDDKSKPELIPFGQIDAKDEFLNIKNSSRDDILAAWRVPPAILGIMPSNVGGFGDVNKAAEVFFVNEIVPLQQEFLELNQATGENILSTSEYQLIKNKE